jgi:hypothetical protein
MLCDCNAIDFFGFFYFLLSNKIYRTCENYNSFFLLFLQSIEQTHADILRLSGDDGRKRLNRTEQKQIKKNSGFIFQITYLTEVS